MPLKRNCGATLLGLPRFIFINSLQRLEKAHFMFHLINWRKIFS